MNIFIKIVLALIAFVAVIKFVSPLLVPIYPPLGILLVVLLLVGIIYWLLWGPVLIP
jgi:hypothetical protein